MTDTVAWKRKEKNEKNEALYTSLLFYLAQAYQNVGNEGKSAEYCLRTLNRQLVKDNVDKSEMSKNCLSLANYYLSYPAHDECDQCLQAALVFSTTETSLAEIQKLRVKFYLSLLRNACKTESKSDTLFPSLHLERLKVACVVDCESARQVLLKLLSAAAEAQKYYIFDGFVTDYMNIAQDCNFAYKAFSNWESDQLKQMCDFT